MSRCLVFVVCALAAGCRKDAPAPVAGASVAQGTERGDCRPDRTCDTGLLCLSNLCVRPPPADCVVVAEQLTSLELGNYAPVEERAPQIARHKASCERVYVTKEEGGCLAKARDKWSASQCVPRLFPELAAGSTSDCAQVAAKIRLAMAPQAVAFQNDPKMSTWFDRTIQVVQQSCEQDSWPIAVKQCALMSTANDVNALNTCNQHMPPALQQKLQTRMAEAMQQLNTP